MTIIDTPGAYEHMALCQHIAALRIETRTGMTHSRGSILKSAQQRFGVTKRTKAGALAQLEQLYADTYGKAYGT
jgi:hypothetical protein